MTAVKFEIGYEIGSGERIDAVLHHLFISGVTQHSGKTTSLEAFVSRVARRTLVFRCGRGEIGFDDATRIPPFFRERTDWQFVEGVLSAHLREKMKFYRGEIIKAVRGAKRLEDVHKNIETKLAVFEKKKPDAFVTKIYIELDQYFREVIPEVRKLAFSKTLELRDGMNLIDLEGIKLTTQQLIIASCVDRIMEEMRDVIIVIPEAWQMIPQDRGSPVKLSVENMIRQGAKIGNYVWLDSQQLTGIDLDILRNVDIWLFGRQTLDREKERVAKMIPGKRVTSDQMHFLTVGQFWLVQYNEKVKFVYVRPSWLPDDIAKMVAMRRLKVEETVRHKPEPRTRNEEDDDMVWKEKYEEAAKMIETLKSRISEMEEKETQLQTAISSNLDGADESKKQVSRLSKELSDLRDENRRLETMVKKVERPQVNHVRPSEHDYVRIADEVLKVLADRNHPIFLKLNRELPDLDVAVERPTVETNEASIRGKLAVLISDGFFDSPKAPKEVIAEAGTRGWGKWSGGSNRVRLFEELKWYCSVAFLRNEGGSYTLLPGVSKRIKVRSG